MIKVYFETYGCSHNFSDSAYMRSLINKDEECQAVNDIEKADYIVLNTCTVKNKTVLNFQKRVKFIEEEYPKAKVVLAGCMTQASKVDNFKETPEMKKFSMIGTNNLDDILIAVKTKGVFQKIESKKRNPGFQDTHQVIENVPISTGCLHFCTYCHTKFARGQLTSYSINVIEKHVKNAVSKGSKIIYLTSQDNGCYGFDLNTDAAELLKTLTQIEGNFMIRFGMANPTHVKKVIKPILDIMKHPKMFKFLHIPIQSGSDKILSDMKRENTTKEYFDIIKLARETIPQITIATDIIVGFPTETEENFQQTINLIKTSRPDVANRAKYSARPTTKAAKMEQLPSAVISERSKKLSKEVEKVSKTNNAKWVGWKGKAIIEDVEDNRSLARNEFYKPIIIKETHFEKGEWIEVEITDTTTFHLNGKII